MHHVCMPGITAPGHARSPGLTVLDGQLGDAATGEQEHRARPSLRLVERPASVLVAGADTARRAALLEELARTMPEGTCFEEASTFSEVLEHAPGCRMAILSGGLDDAPARSLMRVLGQRHPSLPVITVDATGGDGR